MNSGIGSTFCPVLMSKLIKNQIKFKFFKTDKILFKFFNIIPNSIHVCQVYLKWA